MSRLDDLAQLYALFDALEESSGGMRFLAPLASPGQWPRRGVYFFFEHGELRTDGQRLRLVRVGTHGLTESPRFNFQASHWRGPHGQGRLSTLPILGGRRRHRPSRRPASHGQGYLGSTRDAHRSSSIRLLGPDAFPLALNRGRTGTAVPTQLY